MSIEAEIVSWILKFVWLPLVGFIGWLTKTHITNLDQRIKSNEDKVNNLEKEIDKNYYNKEEIHEKAIKL